jgi:hypothetical protein
MQNVKIEAKIDSKGQKIIAAIYLVTNHISDKDPLRLRLREKAIALTETPVDGREVLGHELTTLLEASVLARLISDTNASLLIAEIKYFSLPQYQVREDISLLFTPKGHEIKRTYMSTALPQRTPSFPSIQSVPKKSADIAGERNKRQETILSFINQQKSAGIKDIVTLFPLVSEKTIQRELTALVSSGKITKRGSKRWSVYLAATK